MYGTFKGCKSLATPPTIPNSVTYMGSTFSNCTGLTSYPNIPNHITSYQSMFSGCTQFTSFYQVPEGTTYMYGMFNGCSNMRGSYNIPNTVTDVGYCFNGCTNLSEVVFNCNNADLSHCCNSCTNLVNVMLNCNYVSNAWYSFNNCTNLQNVSGYIGWGSIGWLFQNCQNITNCNLTVGDIYNGSLVFSDCRNLTNLNLTINSVSNATKFFKNCVKLDSFIELNGVKYLEETYADMSIPTLPPQIANTVTNMRGTFQNCTNLITMPDLSNCTDLKCLDYAFCNCLSLVTTTTIPETVTEMCCTFENCTNLVNAPVIPNNVCRIDSLFEGCTNLTGNIYIMSERANTIYGRSFQNTSLQKNVYFPYTYNNGVYTIAYNTFTNYYDENGTTDGVYLKPAFMYLNMSLPTNSTLYINGEVVTNTQQLTIRKDTDYVLIKEGYVPYIKHITYQEGLATDSITDADLSTSGVTLTISPTQSDAIIEFTYLGITSVANSCTVASGTEVIYKVKKSGYKKEIQTVIVTEDITIAVTLEESEIPTTFGSRIGKHCKQCLYIYR